MPSPLVGALVSKTQVGAAFQVLVCLVPSCDYELLQHFHMFVSVHCQSQSEKGRHYSIFSYLVQLATF